MENQLNNQFDKFIYSEMNEFRLDSSFDEQWAKMTVALDKNNFMRFTPSKFNFYYLLLIVSGITISFFLYNNSIKQEYATTNSEFDFQNQEVKVVASPENSISNPSTDIESNENNNLKGRNNLVVSSTKKENVEDESKKEFFTDALGKDSLVSVTENKEQATIVQPDSVKPVVKKIKYVTRRDTIIRIDTTRLKRKR